MNYKDDMSALYEPLKMMAAAAKVVIVILAVLVFLLLARVLYAGAPTVTEATGTWARWACGRTRADVMDYDWEPVGTEYLMTAYCDNGLVVSDWLNCWQCEPV